jgi:hypothetical protein
VLSPSPAGGDARERAGRGAERPQEAGRPSRNAERLPQGVTEKIATVDGVRISYKIAGRGPAVVLLHGFAETSHMWLPLIRLLRESGEKASGTFLIDQGHLVATTVRGVVVKGSGHWLMEEAPQQVIPELVAFINDGSAAGAESVREQLTPGEVRAVGKSGAGAGTSGVSGIETTD